MAAQGTGPGQDNIAVSSPIDNYLLIVCYSGVSERSYTPQFHVRKCHSGGTAVRITVQRNGVSVSCVLGDRCHFPTISYG